MRSLLVKVAVIAVALVVIALGAGLVYERLAEHRDAARYPTTGQLVDVGGRRLHILCKGEGSAPTVIMAGGSGTALSYYGAVQDGIASFARVCAYDRAGSGWSDPVSKPRSLDDMAAELDTLLARAQVPGPYVLVGHSFGGLVVLDFARRYRRKSAGLVLADSAEPLLAYRFFVVQGGLDVADRLYETQEVLARFGVLRLELTFGWGAPKGLPPEIIAELASPKMYRANRLDGRIFYSLNRDPFPPHAFGDLPLIVIRHGHPFVGPDARLEVGWTAAQERLAALSTNSAIKVAEQSGHMVNFEEPKIIVDATQRVVSAVRDGGILATSALTKSRGADARP